MQRYLSKYDCVLYWSYRGWRKCTMSWLCIESNCIIKRTKVEGYCSSEGRRESEGGGMPHLTVPIWFEMKRLAIRNHSKIIIEMSTKLSLSLSTQHENLSWLEIFRTWHSTVKHPELRTRIQVGWNLSRRIKAPDNVNTFGSSKQLGLC